MDIAALQAEVEAKKAMLLKYQQQQEQQDDEDVEYDEEFEEEVVEVDEDGNEYIVEYEEEVIDDDDDGEEYEEVEEEYYEEEDVEESPPTPAPAPAPVRASPTPTRSTPARVAAPAVPAAKTSPAPVATPKQPQTPADGDKKTGGLGSRFKNMMIRPSSEKKEAAPKATAGETKPAVKTRQVRKIRRKKAAEEPSPPAETAGTTTTPEEETGDPDEPKLIHTLVVVKDDASGKELSRTETGKPPPKFQRPGQEKRYHTKTVTRTKVRGNKKTIEVTSKTYEKPRPAKQYETGVKFDTTRSTERHPARKTTDWQQPVWAQKNVLKAGGGSSAIYSGANLEKPITTATTRRSNKGQLSFTIER